MNAPLAHLKSFLAAAPDSLRGYLNLGEIGRVVLAGLVAGSSALAIAEAVATTAATFTSEALGSAIVGVVAAVLDGYRRLKHENLGRDGGPHPMILPFGRSA